MLFLSLRGQTISAAPSSSLAGPDNKKRKNKKGKNQNKINAPQLVHHLGCRRPNKKTFNVQSQQLTSYPNGQPKTTFSYHQVCLKALLLRGKLFLKWIPKFKSVCSGKSIHGVSQIQDHRNTQKIFCGVNS